MCVTITPRAAKYMRRMVRFGEGSAAAGFRLTVKPGGCSGFDSSFTVAEVPQDAHEGTLVIHGEHDETVPLTSVMDWARPQQLPVTVVPGSGHFFHGQLPLLKNLAMRHLRP